MYLRNMPMSVSRIHIGVVLHYVLCDACLVHDVFVLHLLTIVFRFAMLVIKHDLSHNSLCLQLSAIC